MKKLTLLFILILAFATFNSCKTTYLVPVEKLQTKVNQISLEDHSILVVNRANRAYTQTLDSTQIEKFFIDNKLNGDTLIYSRLSNKLATLSMADQLYKNNFKVLVDTITFDNESKRSHQIYEVTPALSSVQMLYLYSTYGIQHALVLEGLATHIISSPERSLEVQNNYILNIKGEYGVYWSYYDLINQKKIFSLKSNDAIYWGSEGYNVKNILKKLPTFYQMNKDIAYVSSEDTSNKIIPSWIKTECVLFIVDKNDPVLIQPKAKKFQWKEVYDYYQKLLSNQKYHSSQNRIYHNLAVCQEMMGNIDNALELINKSLQIKYTHQSNFYRGELINSISLTK